MLFTKDIFESLALIGVISAAIVWYGIVLAQREQRVRADGKKAA
jgi:hypothetical protein